MNIMDDQYAGMTVNERLYVSGLIEDFDKAVAAKDVQLVVTILKKVDLTEPSIGPILKSLGLESGYKDMGK